MDKVISTEKIPIKLWLPDMEEGALAQAKNLANLPFVYKHIAIMPDSHQGYGMPIGGVMATKGYVVPNAVGVDIGCGMCAVKTSLTEIDIDTLKKIMGEIRKAVPVGFNKHEKAQDNNLMPKISTTGLKNNIMVDINELPEWSITKDRTIVSKEYQNALKSLGTLGGGNHFIEIQKGSDGHIWIMIHSGSRNFGLKIADYYNKLAVELNQKWHSSITKDKQLAFLPMESEEGRAYLREMNYAVDFALANRKLMMDNVKGIFISNMKEIYFSRFSTDTIKDWEMINIAHNYAKMENHFGENVMVHRKGATLATKDTVGIIPGSQGTKSYIVKGLGNPDSFNSCSHGAGRKMGRKDAQRRLNLEEEQKALNDKGIIHSVRTVKDLDEAPGSYKNIDEVMKNQEDLVEVLIELQPLAVIKG